VRRKVEEGLCPIFLGGVNLEGQFEEGDKNQNSLSKASKKKRDFLQK
jgi:hypothetical protein